MNKYNMRDYIFNIFEKNVNFISLIKKWLFISSSKGREKQF